MQFLSLSSSLGGLQASPTTSVNSWRSFLGILVCDTLIKVTQKSLHSSTSQETVCTRTLQQKVSNQPFLIFSEFNLKFRIYKEIITFFTITPPITQRNVSLSFVLSLPHFYYITLSCGCWQETAEQQAPPSVCKGPKWIVAFVSHGTLRLLCRRSR